MYLLTTLYGDRGHETVTTINRTRHYHLINYVTLAIIGHVTRTLYVRTPFSLLVYNGHDVPVVDAYDVREY